MGAMERRGGGGRGEGGGEEGGGGEGGGRKRGGEEGGKRREEDGQRDRVMVGHAPVVGGALGGHKHTQMPTPPSCQEHQGIQQYAPSTGGSLFEQDFHKLIKTSFTAMSCRILVIKGWAGLYQYLINIFFQEL